MSNTKKVKDDQEERVDVVPEVDEGVAELEAQVEEYKGRYLRALADYQNFEKRAEKMQDQIVLETQSRLINKLVPFLDNLEKAEVFIKDPGLKMIKDNFMQTVLQMGVTEVEIQGKEYDPVTAEVIEMVPGDKDGIVVEVLQKAYALGGRIIRPGQVRVSQKL